jgi:hypothetical protein
MLNKRDDVVEVIMQFMMGDKETKSFLFDELVGFLTSLLSQLKVALVNGTKEEKKEILGKIKLLRHVMQARFESIKSKANLSQEELNLIMGHLIANSPSYRHKMSSAKQELDVHQADLMKLVNNQKKKSNPMKTKSRWIRS